MRAWYVAYTKVRAELWARSNLWQRGFEVYLPLYRRRRRHARRVDMVSAPLFPRYLFVRADLAAGDRRRIATAPGVEDLVAFGEQPPALPPAVLAEIRGREDESGYVAVPEMPGYRAGEQICVAEGPFGELTGLFESASDNDRVIVLLQLLGREVKVSMPVDRLARPD